MLDLTPDEVLTTTRAVRKRLDLARPVPRDVVEECLAIALQAPNGSNLNSWRWVAVDERARVARMAEIYNAGLDDFVRSLGTATGASYAGAQVPGFEKIGGSVQHLRDYARGPVLIGRSSPGAPRALRRSSRRAWGRSCRPCGASCSRCARADSAAAGRRAPAPRARDGRGSRHPARATRRWGSSRSPTRRERASRRPGDGPVGEVPDWNAFSSR
jgi:nitroreductase